MRPTTVRRQDLAAGLTGSVGPLGSNFMGPQILPPLLVDRQADTFYKPVFTDKALTVDKLERAAKASYGRLNYRTTSDSFATKDEGLEDSIDDVQQALVTAQFSAEQDCANGVFLNLLRQQETAYSAYLFDAATLFLSYKGDVTTEWDNAAAKIYANVQDTFRTIINRVGGVLPVGVERCLAVSSKVFTVMQANTQLLAKRSGGAYNAKSSPQLAMSETEMAQVLEIDRVSQGRAVNGSTDVWDDEYALCFLRYAGSALDVPCLGRTFVWREDGATEYIVETYREEPRKTVVLVRNNTQRYAFNALCGHLLGNIHT